MQEASLCSFHLSQKTDQYNNPFLNIVTHLTSDFKDLTPSSFQLVTSKQLLALWTYILTVPILAPCPNHLFAN